MFDHRRRSTLKSLVLGAAALAVAAVTGLPAAKAKVDEIGVDYAYYNPVSLVLKEKGWLEEEFAADGIKIRWALSLGSNKALEFLAGSSVDFGSTAGAASLLGRAGGNPIKAIYIYSQPEWTALVTLPDSGISKVEDLKGKRVAVTRGTDPHIFLLRALNAAGLTEKDIKVVLLQHPDGYQALVKGDVDAWAGLDPHMAKAELESDAQLFFRDASLNTYGVLNVREEFAAENPELVERVLAVYERARHYALENPEEVSGYLQAYTRVSPEVAAKQLGERTILTNAIIGDEHRDALNAAGQILQEIGLIKPEVDVAATVEELIDPQYIEQISEKKAALK